MFLSSPIFADCLAELLPGKYKTQQLAHDSLDLAARELGGLNIEGVVQRLLRWQTGAEHAAGGRPLRLVFVADEVGGWAGGDLKRIEGLRSFVEVLGAQGQGRLWLIVTSQEKLRVRHGTTCSGLSVGPCLELVTLLHDEP